MTLWDFMCGYVGKMALCTLTVFQLCQEEKQKTIENIRFLPWPWACSKQPQRIRRSWKVGDSTPTGRALQHTLLLLLVDMAPWVTEGKDEDY